VRRATIVAVEKQ